MRRRRSGRRWRSPAAVVATPAATSIRTVPRTCNCRAAAAGWGAPTLANYLFWAVTEGQRVAPDLFYAPLPPSILPLVYSKIASINANGQPLLNAGSVLPSAPSRTEVSTVDNGDGTATTYYSDGTSETFPLG